MSDLDDRDMWLLMHDEDLIRFIFNIMTAVLITVLGLLVISILYSLPAP